MEHKVTPDRFEDYLVALELSAVLDTHGFVHMTWHPHSKRELDTKRYEQLWRIRYDMEHAHGKIPHTKQ